MTINEEALRSSRLSSDLDSFRRGYRTIEKWIQNQINYFECQCGCADHTIRFIYDPEHNELYTEVQLYQYRNFFQRILLAFKYIFGYKCKYGHWDVWMLKPEDCTKLIQLLDKVEKGNHQNEKSS